MRFTKMHGAGNDYVYVDCFEEPVPDDVPALARAVSDRHRGIGADGLILICPSKSADAQMRMYNADGSPAEMCGNGIRCVGKYVYDRGIAVRELVNIETGDRVVPMKLEIVAGKVARARVNMGAPVLSSREIPTTLAGDPPVRAGLDVAGRRLEVTCLSMGNPHCVTFLEELNDDWVLGVGPQIERHSAFPNRVNAEFVRVLSPEKIEMRVWERGSGETQACGSGACAAAVAGVLAGLTERRILACLPGGILEIEWTPSGDVWLTGEAVEVFCGEWPC